ncbi:phage tail length tape measure family protein [Methylobacterium sp. V23]|uniref:phage tail length tape measure family protein n=1 Tax=Methylobacterium sp. V23 TaxID=2044878 RepID=UPI000CDA1CEF|nr:phage tail length tape measure family protein [Methylobacterium sp. V23]POR40513.1 hypothetical protein CRT23_23460 [Methylobacterium sp. V23]
MPTNIAIRLGVEGGAVLKRELEDAGRAGEQSFKAVGAAADAATAATDRLAKRSSEAAEAVRRAPGATGAPASSPASSPSASPATVRELERLRTQLDEEYKRAKQLGTAEDKIGRGFSSGYFDETERDRLRGLAAVRYGGQNDNDPSRRGLSTYDKSFIKYQGFDVASTLGSGGSLTTAAFQQGPQLLQQLADREGGLKAGLTQLGESAKGLVTPFTAAGAAVAATVAVFALASSQYAKDQETLAQSLRTTGRATDLSIAQLEALATRNAEAGKVSTSTAREIAAGYASTGEIAGPVFDTLIAKTAEYAKITGQDVPTATAELARMFADPAKGAEDLGSKLGGLSDRTLQYIATLAEQGDKTQAQIALSDVFQAQVAKNTSATTAWGNAWNFVSSTADKAWESIKRASGMGTVTAQATLADLNLRVSAAEKNGASAAFLDPLRAQRDAAKVEVARLEAEDRARAATEEAIKSSREAGRVTRDYDPILRQRAENQKNLNALNASLNNPESRAELADVDATVRARDAYKRAVDSSLDANGRLIDSQELLRRQDQLEIDSLKAKTAAQKADIAERRRTLELIGKPVNEADARGQIERQRLLARAQADAAKDGSGKSDSEKRDDFDSAERSVQNSIRRQEEQNRTYGLGAEEVARYRVQTELLTAAKRAERDVTPDLSAKIADYAAQAGEAAKRMDELRENTRRTDQYRDIGSDGVRTFVRGLSDGVAQGKVLENVLSNIKSRVADLAANSISDVLFGKRGGSDYGLLSGLLGGGNSLANAPAPGAQGPTAQAGGLGSLLASAKSFFEFERGGYTGDGGRFDVRGIVHAGEVVWSQDDVARFGGVGAVEAMRRGASGYTNGGAVRSGAFQPPPSAARGGSGPQVNIINNGPPMQAQVQQRPDGSMDVILDQLEDRSAGRAATGRGAFADIMPGARRLRG